MKRSPLFHGLTILLFSLLFSQAAVNPIIPFGANWRYLDNGTDQGTNWSQRTFNDASWPAGPAQLGYSTNPAEADEATTVGFGPNPNIKYITTYFRYTFVVSNPSDYTALVARLLVDDGAVVYLNGVEAYRTNMPNGVITNGTLAVAAFENTLCTNSIPLSMLLPGTNVLAVEVHQNGAFTTDLSFDFELRGIEPPPPNFPPTVGISAPLNGASYAPPATVNISASASDSDGTVVDLSLYQNGSLLLQSASSPVNFSWSGVPAGVYAITAVAAGSGAPRDRSDAGARARSGPIRRPARGCRRSRPW